MPDPIPTAPTADEAFAWLTEHHASLNFYLSLGYWSVQRFAPFAHEGHELGCGTTALEAVQDAMGRATAQDLAQHKLKLVPADAE